MVPENGGSPIDPTANGVSHGYLFNVGFRSTTHHWVLGNYCINGLRIKNQVFNGTFSSAPAHVLAPAPIDNCCGRTNWRLTAATHQPSSCFIRNSQIKVGCPIGCCRLCRLLAISLFLACDGHGRFVTGTGKKEMLDNRHLEAAVAESNPAISIFKTKGYIPNLPYLSLFVEIQNKQTTRWAKELHRLQAHHFHVLS